MHIVLKNIILPLVAFFMLEYGLSAQPKAAGMEFSFSGVSLSYDHQLKDGCFLNLSLRTELSEVFLNNTDTPGISISATYNYIIRRWKSQNENELVFFAGPGVAIGRGKDYKDDNGYFFGLKGRTGLECCFHQRNVVISASIAPVLGMHLILLDDSLKMHYFRYGLLNTIMPEIGIRYMF